jgi:hypothetical protein
MLRAAALEDRASLLSLSCSLPYDGKKGYICSVMIILLRAEYLVGVVYFLQINISDGGLGP